MRILLLSSEFPPYSGGISTYAVEMAHAAHQLGAQVRVAAPDFGNDLTKSDLAYPFRVERFSGGLHTVKDVPEKCLLVKRLLKNSEYDLIHAIDWPFFVPVSLFSGTTKRLYTIHGSDVNDMASSYKPFVIRLLRLFSGPVEIVANSEFTKNLFIEKFGYVGRTKVRHELLGVSEYWKERTIPSSSDRVSLGLPDEKFIIVTVARLTPRKNQLGVIEALKLLSAEDRLKVCYAIVGPEYDSLYTKAIKAAIEGAGLDVRLLGRVGNDDLRRIYACSDLFCLVGKPIPNGPVEGFGLVFLEAGAQGLPSLAGDIGGVREVMLDGYNGMLIPPDDPSLVANAIAGLIHSPAKLEKLRLGARQRASDLSWLRCAAETYRLPISEISNRSRPDDRPAVSMNG
ncbi:glycosyltransferase family 4 protein [Bradyrhizobium sp. AT1]|uniref:glycosyltransferase family 4 protein n=1 Tax=Bradyrhizobium sp. AT1 TaxID=574934 RepID=UPI000AE5C587|nr:glycosyltransferase family 4 protein [Bradyrhizobium sp. AT1]